MGKMFACPCGCTVISPQGEEDARKHAMIHLRDAHPGTTMTEAELANEMRTV